LKTLWISHRQSLAVAFGLLFVGTFFGFQEQPNVLERAVIATVQTIACWLPALAAEAIFKTRRRYDRLAIVIAAVVLVGTIRNYYNP
jgi:hypothetical protein